MISKQGRTVEAVRATVIEGEVPVLCLGRKRDIIYLVSGAHSGGNKNLSCAYYFTTKQWAFQRRGSGQLLN